MWSFASFATTQRFVLYCTVYVTFMLYTRPEVSAEDTSSSSPRQQRWADAAFEFIRTLNCREVFVMTAKECKVLTSMDKSKMNVYVAEPTAYGNYEAVLPDGGLKRSGRHSAVVAIDPYPGANFGHLVVVFYVDIDMTWSLCQVEGGKFIGDGQCLKLALKKRCKNAILRRRKRRNFAHRCEINFIPRVFLPNRPGRQHMTCRDDVTGFRKCPELRPESETSRIICNPLRDNTKRCETTQQTIKTSCSVFDICDQAVLISGGWNRQTGQPRHAKNVLNMFKMLRKYGFNRKNIKIFYANGAVKFPGFDEEVELHPSAMKLAMRYHIKKICETPHCVDSLLLYLNSPARSDGTSLLWDANGDGIAEESERYSLEELLSDLEQCTARQVHVVADQSYAGEIARAVSHSETHSNVIVFSSTHDNEHSWESDFTDHWVNSDHSNKCSRTVHTESLDVVQHSRPEVGEGFQNYVNTTIFGAPCNAIPRFSADELRRKFYGCQNLPTALWLAKLKHSNKQQTTSVFKNSRRNG